MNIILFIPILFFRITNGIPVPPSPIKKEFLTKTIEPFSILPKTGFTGINIKSAPGSDATMKFFTGLKKSAHLTLQSNGLFLIKMKNKNVIEFTPNHVVKLKGCKVYFKEVSLNKYYIFEGQAQWRVILQEIFSLKTPPSGWNSESVTKCGGIVMLGGFGKQGGGELNKTYSGFPEHKYVRIKGNFHFIDAWQGETAYLKVNIGTNRKMEYVWTDKYDYTASNLGGTNICGADYPENKFTTSIDVILPHTEEDITIGFGGTIDTDAYDNSFGISSIQISIK